MSVLSANPRVTKTSHTVLIALGLAALPVALLLAAAYGSEAARSVSHTARAALTAGDSHLPAGVVAIAIAVIGTVIVFTLSVAIQALRAIRDDDRRG